MADIMPAIQAEAARAETAVLGAATQVQGIALTGFADAHAYAQHIASTAAAVGSSDLTKAVAEIKSHLAGALLAAMAFGAVAALAVAYLLPRVLGH